MSLKSGAAALTLCVLAASCAGGGDSGDSAAAPSGGAAGQAEDPQEAETGGGSAPAVGETGLIDPTMRLNDAIDQQIELFVDAELGETTRGITDDTIRVTGVVSATFGDEPLYSGACEGARARFERANRERELTRQIEIVGCVDDESDLRANQAAIDDAIGTDEVFAIVPSTSAAFFAQDLAATERVPFVGWGFQPGYCGYETGFGFGHTGAVDCPVLEASGLRSVVVGPIGLYERAAGVDTFGLAVAHLAEDRLGSAAVLESVALEAEQSGAEVVYAAASLPLPADPEPSSWEAIVEPTLAAEPDVVLIDSAGSLSLYAALREAGFEGDIVAVGAFDPLRFNSDEAYAAALLDSWQITQGINPTDSFGEQWGQMATDAMAVDHPTDEMGRDFIHGYVAADFFVQAAAATLEPFSAETFFNAVNGGWEYPGLGSLACGGWWPASHVVSYSCASVARVTEDGVQHVLDPTYRDITLDSRFG